MDVNVDFLANGGGNRDALQGEHPGIICCRRHAAVRFGPLGRGLGVVVSGALLARAGVLAAFEVVYDLGGAWLQVLPTWQHTVGWRVSTSHETQHGVDNGFGFREKSLIELLTDVIWQKWPEGVQVEGHNVVQS